jgi:cytoskeleton protein RodZ
MKDNFHEEEPAITPAETENADSVGGFLRQERLRQNKDLKEVAEATCIHIATIQALEEDKRSKLPAEVFVRGFISIYAQYLKLDVQDVLNRYGRKRSAEWVSPGADYERKLEARDIPGGPAAAGKRFPKLFLLALLAILLAYGGYRLLSPMAIDNPGGHEETAGESESLAEPPVQNGPEAVITPNQPALMPPAEPEVLIAPEPPVLESSSTQARNAGERKATGDQTGGKPPEAPFTTPALPETTAATLSPAAPAVSESVAETPSQLVAFDYELAANFSESTWLQVLIDNQKPVEYLFKPGEGHRWQAREQISLFLGNAGGVELTLNGEPQPRPGRSGQTARVSFP